MNLANLLPIQSQFTNEELDLKTMFIKNFVQ